MSEAPSLSAPPALRVGLISLGCAKNLVDAEIMLGTMMKAGVSITNDPSEAEVVIVNTCSFIDAAQEESVDTILESDEVRRQTHPGQALIVSGCLPQRFRDDLPKLLPEVDAFMGIDQVAGVMDVITEALKRRAARLERTRGKPDARRAAREVRQRLVELEQIRPTEAGQEADSLKGTEKHNRTRTMVAPKAEPKGAFVDVNLRPNFIPDFGTPRFRLTPRHLAYVKIAEGCNHPCSFCIIPRMRGTHRSRSQTDVVREARQLVADGVRELNLISQDSTYYGLDLRPKHSRAIASPERFSAAAKAVGPEGTTLCTLLRELNALPGDFWVRLLYTHPAHWTDELIETLAECRKVARYVDIPLQHIHPLMLERMRRETSAQHIIDLLGRIRRGIPGIALRTTFIVGFPGETEACFERLLEFIRETRFERLGVFTYSPEAGTRAAGMAGQIPDAEKQRRRDVAMAAQHAIARELSAAAVGRTLRVLLEKEASGKDLRQARVASWEHGFIRETEPEEALKGRFLVARGAADAPDIDGRIYVRLSPHRGKSGAAGAGRGAKAREDGLAVGEFAEVKIIGHTDYDLIAEPADRGSK
jgi:ribosomal protein S12 methylthiotransferase